MKPTEITELAEAICRKVTEAQCLWEWDNVNDPPCHPSDDGWKGCSSCYANRSILAVAFREAAAHLKPPLSETPWLTKEDGYFNETLENCVALGELMVCQTMQVIANYLEPREIVSRNLDK